MPYFEEKHGLSASWKLMSRTDDAVAGSAVFKEHILESFGLLEINTCKIPNCSCCLTFSKLIPPNLIPEKIYTENTLCITHTPSGGTISFTAIDALDQMLQQESSQPLLEDKLFPYSGSVSGFKIVLTEEKIDVTQINMKERVTYYQDIILYEDTIQQGKGFITCNVKIRVMETSFIILLRKYVNVQDSLITIHDTRFFHQFDKNYVLRECTSRKQLGSITLTPEELLNQELLSSKLPLVGIVNEKLLVAEVADIKNPAQIESVSSAEKKESQDGTTDISVQGDISAVDTNILVTSLDKDVPDVSLSADQDVSKIDSLKQDCPKED